jgi:hypothetical protein
LAEENNNKKYLCCNTIGGRSYSPWKHVRDPVIGIRIIIKCVLEQQGVSGWTRFTWLRTVLYYYGDETSDYIRVGNFFTSSVMIKEDYHGVT